MVSAGSYLTRSTRRMASRTRIPQFLRVACISSSPSALSIHQIEAQSRNTKRKKKKKKHRREEVMKGRGGDEGVGEVAMGGRK